MFECIDEFESMAKDSEKSEFENLLHKTHSTMSASLIGN